MNAIIEQLNAVPSELLLVAEFFLCSIVLAFLTYYYRLVGIYAFIILSMIIVNIQVLKSISLSCYPEPLALGMVVICFSFLATDLLTECYGKDSARKGVWLGFFTNFILVFFMLLTVGYSPEPGLFSPNLHMSIQQIFIPMPNIFLASLASYLISQLLDITIYVRIKAIFSSKLWLKSFVSTSLSSIIDNGIFVFLAFYLLHPEPMPLEQLFKTYFVAAFVLRLLIVLFSSFLMHALKSLLNASERETLILDKELPIVRRDTIRGTN